MNYLLLLISWALQIRSYQENLWIQEFWNRKNPCDNLAHSTPVPRNLFANSKSFANLHLSSAFPAIKSSNSCTTFANGLMNIISKSFYYSNYKCSMPLTNRFSSAVEIAITIVSMCGLLSDERWLILCVKIADTNNSETHSFNSINIFSWQ